LLDWNKKRLFEFIYIHIYIDGSLDLNRRVVSVHINVYIYVCVCVCVCGCGWNNNEAAIYTYIHMSAMMIWTKIIVGVLLMVCFLFFIVFILVLCSVIFILFNSCVRISYTTKIECIPLLPIQQAPTRLLIQSSKYNHEPLQH